MKTLTLLFSLTFSLNANCQDIAKQLQRQMWYVKGDLYRGQPTEIYLDKPAICSGYLIFNKTGELEMHLTETDNKFVCLYELLNDKLKLHYKVNFSSTNKSEEVNLFYKFKELSNGKDYELIPITSVDYK